MSLVIAPNLNEYITRISDILKRSAQLFPKTVGLDDTKEDLVQQVIMYEIPIIVTPVTGGGPPHIVVTTSKTPIIEKIRTGRDSRNEQGPERWTLEFYVYVISQSTDLTKAEALMYDITSAVETTLGKNLRLTDENNENPLSATLETIELPLLLNIEQREIIARNVVVRPQVYVNLRES